MRKDRRGLIIVQVTTHTLWSLVSERERCMEVNKSAGGSVVAKEVLLNGLHLWIE